jgi:hypothetical protein
LETLDIRHTQIVFGFSINHELQCKNNPNLKIICVNNIKDAQYSISADATVSLSKTCAATTDIKVDKIVESVFLFPNPLQDLITIAEGNTLALYNTVGVLVLQANTPSVNIASLQSGVYCAKITDANGKTTLEKLIKE